MRSMLGPISYGTCARDGKSGGVPHVRQICLDFFWPFLCQDKRAEDDVYAGKQKKEKKTKKVTATRLAWAARLGELNVYILNTLYRRY